MDIPAIALNAGPMLNGWHDGERTGSGTIVWKARELMAAGEIDYPQFLRLVASSAVRKMLAAAVLCDAVIRLLPGALGDERSTVDESFSDPKRLEAPAYTRPIEFRGLSVPEVLISGHHGKIQDWKDLNALERTRRNRPDLLE